MDLKLWVNVPEFIESEERLHRLLKPGTFRMGHNWNDPVLQEQVILIGAVDNNRSRQLCHSVSSVLSKTEVRHLRLGSGEEENGEAVLSVRRQSMEQCRGL